jgi:hypothetical protein
MRTRLRTEDTTIDTFSNSNSKLNVYGDYLYQGTVSIDSGGPPVST